MWTIFKVFIEFVTILLLFLCFGILALRYVGSQLPEWGLNPHPCVGWQGPNSGPPGDSGHGEPEDRVFGIWSSLWSWPRTEGALSVEAGVIGWKWGLEPAAGGGMSGVGGRRHDLA